MKVQAVTIDMECLGSIFANLGDTEQSAFFRGLARELMRFPSHHMKEMQFAYVANKLTKDEKEELEIIFSMLFNSKE